MNINALFIGVIASFLTNNLVHAAFLEDTSANLYLKNF